MERITINKSYPLQIWLTSIVLAPALLVIFGFISSSNPNMELKDLPVLILFVLFGVFLSLPVFIITFLVHRLAIKKLRSPLIIKAILIAFSMVGVFLTFMIIQGVDSFNWKGNRSGLIYSLIYSGSIIIASMFYRIWKLQDEPPIRK